MHNPNPATSKMNYVHIIGMYLGATGANSKVVDLTSIGHSIIESNNLALGTGGTSYGIFGDTSTGGFDSTNTLIHHNNIGLNSTGDTCLRLAGVYNAVVIEQNICTLAPASSLGYVFKKDSSGNYPNNDEIYGNDCEASSAAFGQVCYDVIGAHSVTFGPNNRCENVYNCFEFPADGSAIGIHVIDPYISVSNTAQLLPNEPSTATIAIDNNGHNWLPSMHFGMNDLGGDNLVGNSAFEGWQNSTTLYSWGGVCGTNINQAGSGIYAQNTSAGANPGIDTYTQGTYNVHVGDDATAGLGVNSACIQVDSTREYTLMFRVASASTSNNFRPGFRFYSDANCTEANRITTASSNARVLAPANYDGTSNSTGNWQSTNVEARSAQGMRRVLVVEDDPVLRESIHALLKSETVEIVEAGSIASALDEMARATFDCVVMDLALPDGSGYELLERVSTGGEHASPPVIVYTGRMLSQEEEQRLRRYSKSIIIKGAKSPERLLDEVTLFLHSVESALPPEQQRMLRAARQRDDVFEGRTILLAEDDVRNIFALSHVIEPLGAKLEIARNGREALDALARHPGIDLVLMDIMMPEMDGLTAMAEIRKLPEHARLPIIALTAKAMPSDRQKCLEAGADDYISKPIDVDKLVSLCRVWLR